MREDDLLKFRWIADPQISPDGTRVAFTLVRVDVEEDDYRTDLWLAPVPAAGAPPQPPRALTLDGRSAQPRLSPDGATPACSRPVETREPTPLYLLPLARRAVR